MVATAVSVSAYRYVVILFAGFLQRVGSPQNGILQLRDRLYRSIAGPDFLIDYYPWYIGADEIARMISELDAECEDLLLRRLRVMIVGFSWGGATAVQVCSRLARQGICVDQLTLCDPVARHGRLGWLRALLPWSRLVVPDSVLRLTVFRQRHPRFRPTPPFFFPGGQRVVSGANTRINGVFELDLEHWEMDSAPDFHRVVFAEANRLKGST